MNEFWQQWSPFLHLPDQARVMLRLALIIVMAWVLLRVARKGIELIQKVVANQSIHFDDVKRAETLTRVLRWALNIAVILIAGMLMLNELGVSIAPLLATAGVVGIAVGFGAQTLVKDFFTGFFLLLENQVRVGDTIEIAGKSGVVEFVTLRYIRLRDGDGVVHFVPNGAITLVSNRSMGFAYANIEVGIDYSADVDVAMQIVREVAAHMRLEDAWKDRVLDDIEMFGVDRLGDSAVILRARVRVASASDAPVRREMNRRIKLAFDKAGIPIPFPQLTIRRA